MPKTIKSELLYVVLGLILTLVFISIYNTYINGDKNISNDNQILVDGMQELTPTSTDAYKIYEQNAKFTIINYFSIDCKECRRAYLLEDNLLDKLKSKVNVTYRNNPLSSQPLSADKAVIAECVKEIDKSKYFDFLSDAFNHFDILNINNNWFKKLAYKYVDDKDKLDECIISDYMKNKINNQKIENNIAGIVLTPAIILFENGVYKNFYNGIGGAGVTDILKSLTEK